MDPIDSLAGVPSFSEAQSRVPFPVQEVGVAAERIDVRLPSRTRWATVRSEHSLGAVRFVVKQCAVDWLGRFSAPNKLYSTKTGRWELCGPTAQIPHTRGTAFHGRDREGREAVSITTLGVHVEIYAREGSFGADGVRTLLDGIRPVDAPAATTLSRRPMAVWNWAPQAESMIPGGPPGPSDTRWTESPSEAAVLWRAPVRAPALPGWAIDSFGIKGERGAGSVRLLYRSDDLHVILEVVRAEGPTDHHWTGLRPAAPLFEAAISEMPGVLAMTAPGLRWSVYTTRTGSRSLKVVVPPGWSIPERDTATVRDLIRKLLDPGL
jgi:hypothetical protein